MKKLINLLIYMLNALAANPKRARLFHDPSLASEDAYEPFLRYVWDSSMDLCTIF